eukprot:1948669-Rhodomonas_salina.3
MKTCRNTHPPSYSPPHGPRVATPLHVTVGCATGIHWQVWLAALLRGSSDVHSDEHSTAS